MIATDRLANEPQSKASERERGFQFEGVRSDSRRVERGSRERPRVEFKFVSLSRELSSDWRAT